MEAFKLASYLLLAIIACSVSAQDPADGCRLEGITDGLLGVLLMTGGVVPLNTPITVTRSAFNCLAAGRVREHYREVTITVEYNGGSVATLDLVCNSTSQEWGLPSSYNGAIDTPLADQDHLLSVANVQLDCVSCNRLGPFNPEWGPERRRNHCIPCVDECYDVGQNLCYGNSGELCCNYYLNDMCVLACPPAFVTNNSTFFCDCNFECMNGGTQNASCTGCDCLANFRGVNCEECVVPNCQTCSQTDGECLVCADGYVLNSNNQCECNFECMNGGTQNASCTGCDCLANFRGVNCEECVVPNCQTCSRTDGECLVCFDGFMLTSNNRCVIDCSDCNQLSGETQRKVCTYFCGLEPWINEGISCGLDQLGAVSIARPNYDEAPEELQQIAVNAGEAVDQVWVDGAIAESLADVSVPVYGTSPAEWQDGVRQYVQNFQSWQAYVATVYNNFPVTDLSSLLQDIGTRPDSEIYYAIQELWLMITNDFTNLIALRQCTI